MDFKQIVLMFVKGFYQIVDQVRTQRPLANHHVPDTDGRNRLVDSPVHTSGQIDCGIFFIGGNDFLGLFRSALVPW